jgi:sialate O-acetylesterase
VKRRLQSFSLLFVLAFIAGDARADVKLPALISDGMVLQQGTLAPLWGWADEGESVTVEFQKPKATS